MMKKVLVLMLVLGISSMASAGTVDLVISSLNGDAIDPVSEITIGESDWVNLDIVYSDDGDGLTLIQLSTTVVVSGLASLDLTQLTIPAGMWDPDTTYSPGVDGDSMLYSVGFLYPPYGALDGDIAIDHILVHCDSDDPTNIVTVTLADKLVAGLGTINEYYSAVAMGNGVTITQEQIPEPMTLALLGMGGLFLVRRKK